MIINEIHFLRDLYLCENFISLESVHRAQGKFYLVLKYAESGCLRNLLIRKSPDRLSEVQIRSIMQQLNLATDFMHRKQIIHRDFKPQNILILDSEVLMVCIADLGLAIREDDEKRKMESCGTPGYVDPEVLNGRPFTTKSDIFSLGSLLFNLITHKIVFPGFTA
jgi:serine/threonine protein kinase